MDHSASEMMGFVQCLFVVEEFNFGFVVLLDDFA